jgi:hypothetical protein
MNKKLAADKIRARLEKQRNGWQTSFNAKWETFPE